MAINIQNIIAALEAKVAAATSSTETQELIVIIKSIKAAGQQTIVTYANVAALPTPSAENAGNLAYVAEAGKIYYSNSTTWTEVGSGSGGGSGSSFDQSLNTTDDVVFNSALIGDVSIIGNEISATDAYGNDAELILNGDLTIKADSLTLVTETLSSGNNVNYTAGGTASGYPELSFQQQYNNWSTQDLDKLASIPPGTDVQFTDLSSPYGISSGSFTVVSVESSVDYYGYPYVNLRLSNIATTSGDNGWTYFMSTLNNINFSWSSSGISKVDVVTVTGTGLNVNGEFTVNGQPVSGGSGEPGSSFDQNLNTTDDVVFNSSLIGDVSIIGNKIAATDSYGNTDTLELITPVDFKSVVTTGADIQLQTNPNNLYTNNNQVVMGNFASYNAEYQAVQIAAIPSGTLVTTNTLFNNATYESSLLRFVVQSTQLEYDPYNPSSINSVVITVVPGTLSYSFDNGITWTEQTDTSYNPYYSQASFIWLYYNTSNTVENTIASVTESALNISGQLNVTGGGDVVLDAALIGDVTIVGNTIAGIDSYGNTGGLALSTPVNFTKTETTGSQTVINFGFESFRPVYDYSTYTEYVRLYTGGLDPAITQQLASIPSGTLVTTNDLYDFNTYTSKRFRFIVTSSTTQSNDPYNPSVVSEVRYTVTAGSLQYSIDGINWYSQSFDNSNYNNNQSQGTITYGEVTTVETNVVSVTEDGADIVGNINVTGSLSVNGKAVGATPTAFGVGSYAMLQLASGNGDITAGQTVMSAEGFAVGPLFPAAIIDASGTLDNSSQPIGVAGTWMCMGYAPSSAGPAITLWYRVS